MIPRWGKNFKNNYTQIEFKVVAKPGDNFTKIVRDNFLRKFDIETLQDRIASYFQTGGKVTSASFYNFGDKNRSNNALTIRLNYFSAEGLALDTMANYIQSDLFAL